MVQGLGFRVQGLGSLRFGGQGLGFRAQGFKRLNASGERGENSLYQLVRNCLHGCRCLPDSGDDRAQV